jgi:hypothetical protein
VLRLVFCLLINGAVVAQAQESEISAPREANTDPDAVVTLGPSAGGSGSAPLVLCNAVKWAEVVVHGTIREREPVRVIEASGTGHDEIVSVSVTHTWKAPSRDSLRIRILADAESSPGSTRRRPLFRPGSECVFFLTPDERGELVAAPGSVTLPDTLVYWTLGARPPSSSAVVAMVDSCAALWSLPAIASDSDLIVEGTVRSCRGNPRSWTLVLDDRIVHRGASASDTLRLVSNARWRYPSLPPFHEGERVVLLARGWGGSLFDLVGGWQGAWVVTPSGELQQASRFPPGGLGVVTDDSEVRPSRRLACTLTRSEFVTALEGH